MRPTLIPILVCLGAMGCGQEGAAPPIATRDPAPATPPKEASPSPSPSPAPAPAPVAEAVALPPAPAGLLTVPATVAAAPATFTITWDTTKGAFDMTCHREWAPHGADRLYDLVQRGFFTDTAFFRVVEGFMAQFGLHGHPDVNAVWLDASIPDDPRTQSNTRGMVSFATRGPDTRTTQLFISFADNSRLDDMGFSPVCQVDAAGMKIVDSLYNGYGEGAPRGAGPRQDFIHKRGNPYLRESFDKLDYVRAATIR